MTPSQRQSGPSTRVRVLAHVHAREFDGEVVILDLEAGKYFALDEIGAKVWLGMAEGRPLGELAETIGAEFDAPAEVIERDLSDLCDRWLDLGLVEVER